MNNKLNLKQLDMLSANDKVNRSQGFTLIEVMIVAVIIGILAAVAIQQYSRFQKDAKKAAVEASFHNLSLAQENYYHEDQHNTYTQDLTNLMLSGYMATPNVTILILTSDGVSWRARARYIGMNEIYEYDSLLGGVQPDPIIVP